MAEFPDVLDNIRVVASQWNEEDSPEFYRQLQEKLQLFNTTFIEPLEFAAMQNNLNSAEGVFLDYLGVRLGVQRPIIDDIASLDFIGFSAEDVGFDQGPFKTIDPLLGRNIGISDDYYRRILQGRVIYNFVDDTLKGYEDIYSAVFLNSRIQESTSVPYDLELFIEDYGPPVGLPLLWNIMRDFGLIWRPMCRTYSIPFGMSSLTAGTGELFRFVVTVGDISSNQTLWSNTTALQKGGIKGNVQLSADFDGLLITSITWNTNRTFTLTFSEGDPRVPFTATSGIDIHIYTENDVFFVVDSSNYTSASMTEVMWSFPDDAALNGIRSALVEDDEIVFVFAFDNVEKRVFETPSTP